jgi:hypothetical protein
MMRGWIEFYWEILHWARKPRPYKTLENLGAGLLARSMVKVSHILSVKHRLPHNRFRRSLRCLMDVVMRWLTTSAVGRIRELNVNPLLGGNAPQCGYGCRYSSCAINSFMAGDRLVK